MLKATTLAIAIGAITMLFALDAGALPLAPVKSQATVESNTKLVRDDCGRDRHFSERQNKCVDNDEDEDSDRGGRRHAGNREKNFAVKDASTSVRTATRDGAVTSTAVGCKQRLAWPVVDRPSDPQGNPIACANKICSGGDAPPLWRWRGIDWACGCGGLL